MYSKGLSMVSLLIYQQQKKYLTRLSFIDCVKTQLCFITYCLSQFNQTKGRRHYRLHSEEFIVKKSRIRVTFYICVVSFVDMRLLIHIYHPSYVLH